MGERRRGGVRNGVVEEGRKREEYMRVKGELRVGDRKRSGERKRKNGDEGEDER